MGGCYHTTMAFGDPKTLPLTLSDGTVKEVSRPNFWNKQTAIGFCIGGFKAACFAAAASFFGVGIVGACILNGLGFMALFRDVRKGAMIGTTQMEKEYQQALQQREAPAVSKPGLSMEQVVERSGIHYRDDHAKQLAGKASRQPAASLPGH